MIGRRNFVGPYADTSNYYFEAAFLYSKDHSWPVIENLPLRTVHSWLSSVRAELSMVPSTRMESVIFALLHISQAGASPTAVTWLFYALETFYDTKTGENFRSMVERIRIFLSPDDKQLQNLRKKLRLLYDIRSAFIHGGLRVIHPLNNEILDKSIEEEYSRLSDAIDFGFCLILSSIQEIIKRGWIEPEFREIVVGKPTGYALA